MPRENAIVVDAVAKRFRLRGAAAPSLKARALGLFSRGSAPARREFWALRDVSFGVARGETLGIIGVNGAGKSTLLSLLAGTKQPTRGRIETRGTVSCLLELGAGFHPDLTGRENVFLSGAIMGLSRARMRERFDAIVEFAELGGFIDQPVRHYSSGMYVRLGFAVAVEVDPDILLIDEVLAVGDVNFQRKCIRRMGAFREQGKTMLIISHDLRTIQSISDRILLLDEGAVLGIGDPETLVARYESLARERATRAIRREWGTGDVRITGVELVDENGRPADTFRWGGTLTARLAYRAARRVDSPVFGFAVSDEGGRLVHGSNSQIEPLPIEAVEGEGRVTLRLEDLSLAAGTYLLSFSVHSADHKTNYHRLDNCFPFVVTSGKPFEGLVFLRSRWERGGEGAHGR